MSDVFLGGAEKFLTVSAESASRMTSRSVSAFAVVEADPDHAFAEAAFMDKVRFQVANQLVEEVVGLVNQANGDVRERGGRAGIQPR